MKGSKEIIVTFLDGRSYKAEIIGVDEYTDIAVLHVNTSKDTLTPLLIGDSSRLKVRRVYCQRLEIRLDFQVQ